MSSVRKMLSAWVGAACCLAMIGCSDRKPTTAVSAGTATPPAAAEPSNTDSPAESAAQTVAQSSPEPRWNIVEKTDEMAGTVTRFALYRANIDGTTVDVELTCPEQGADGGLLQVTTYDGVLATAFDEVLGHPSATARVDTGSGEIRSIALMQSAKYGNVYFYVNRGGVQMKNVLAMDIPLLRDAPIGASSLGFSGDPAHFKLELELANGTKRVIRGDATLAQYVQPCTAEAEGQRQQQKAEEQRQLQVQRQAEEEQRREERRQRAQEDADQWLREQQEVAEVTERTAESAADANGQELAAGITPPSTQGRGARITQPEYPPASRRAGEAGTVALQANVLEDGRVGEVRVEKSSGFDKLDEAAVREVQRNWRFVPGEKNGMPTRMWHSFSLTFRLND